MTLGAGIVTRPSAFQVFIAIVDVGVLAANWFLGNVIAALFVAAVTGGFWWSWGMG